jgi:hypothetical protein
MATWTTILADGDRASVIRSVQAATESAPSSADDGLSLFGMAGFTMMVECDPGQSFGSGGQLDLYHLDPKVGLPWSLLADREINVPPSVIGLQRFTLVFDVVRTRGRVAFAANGLVLTGGGVTLTILPGYG